MESGLASRTIPMDRHRFSSLYPRPTFWSEHTHIKPRKRTKNEKNSLSQNSCKFLSNCFRSVITTCVSCIATIKNLITNLEKCQKSHPEEFFFVFNFSSLILAQLFFLKVFLHYVCAHRKIGLLSSKKCQLVSLFMECNSVCIFLRSRKLPSSHTNMWISSACMLLLTSHIESSFPELRRFWLTDDDVRKKSLSSSN